MLHASTLTEPSSHTSSRTPRPIAGGEAWVVPFEPGNYAWITASAPTIRVVDRRRSGATPQAR
jgi:hypothetical protein